MATNFPASVDSLTNPVSNDSLNSPSHSAQHANANDAIEAVEDYLLNGAGKTGLVLLNTTNFTAQSTVSINSVFSATYTDYLIEIEAVQTISSAFTLRLRASGTDNSNSTYNTSGIIYFSDNATSLLGAENATSYSLTGGNTLSGNYQVEVFNPFATKVTQFITNGVTSAGSAGFEARSIRSVNVFEATTSFDGFSIFTASGNITGTIKVYGYK